MSKVWRYRQDHVNGIGCRSDESEFLVDHEAVSDRPPQPQVVKQNVWSNDGSVAEIEGQEIIQDEFDNEKQENRYQWITEPFASFILLIEACYKAQGKAHHDSPDA